MHPIRFEPYFIEESVFLRIKQLENAVIPAKAIASGDQAVNFSKNNVENLDPRLRGDDDQDRSNRTMVRSFHERRTHIYETVGKEGQKQAFQTLNESFFRALGLDKSFSDHFQEFPLLQSSDIDMYVKSTFQKRQERSELFIDGSARTLILSLRVLQAIDPQLLAPFLRHELMHISDMVDPDFQYDPNPAMGGVGQVEEELIRDRFRVLWNLYVSARLVQRGHEPFIPFNNLKGEFEQSFSHIDEEAKAKVIQNFVGQKKWTQAELLQLARNERINKTLGEGGLLCPLCHFTSYEDKRVWSEDQHPLIAEIQKDFSAWGPAAGLCSQCFDLYSSRVRSSV